MSIGGQTKQRFSMHEFWRNIFLRLQPSTEHQGDPVCRNTPQNDPEEDEAKKQLFAVHLVSVDMGTIIC